MATDPVNSPSHYTLGGLEVIDIIEAKFDDAQVEGFLLGNVVKYILRAGHKEEAVVDLRKARWYLDRLIRKLEQ